MVLLLDFMAKYWTILVFLGGILAAMAKWLYNLAGGVLAVLHDRLYQSCRHYIKQGSVDVDGMKNLEYMYRSYHALGGNGTGTELYNRVKDLKIEED